MIIFYKIPVYSCSKEDFEKKYTKNWDMKREKYKGTVYDKALGKLLSSRLCWEYNQIIGYIEVFYEDYSINFKAYKNYEKRVNILGNKRKWFTQLISSENGRHIDIYQPNEIISENILEELLSIMKEDYPKKAFIDLDEFNLVKDLIDYNKIIDNHLK